jgi:transcriptional regulator with XRE-family HTH domain
VLSYTDEAARRLADLIDQARSERDWSVADLAVEAGVSRPTVSRLINHAEIPVRQRTRDAIGVAFGWPPGSCDAVLAGAEMSDTDDVLSVSIAAAQRLAEQVEQARVGTGFTKHELSRIAGVPRPVVSKLINHAEVPGRQSVRDAIGAALGWEAGSCDAILAGGAPTFLPSAQWALVVAERLQVIAEEAESAAADNEQQALRWRQIAEQAQAAAEDNEQKAQRWRDIGISARAAVRLAQRGGRA